MGGRTIVAAATCLVLFLSNHGQADAQSIHSVRFLSALDLDGKHHRIGEPDESMVTALVFMTTECPISRQYVPELNRLAERAASEAVRFYGVIADPSITRTEAHRFQREFKIGFPVLFDASGELAAAFEPTHVPEAFVLDQNRKIVYRGRIDDQYADVDKKRPHASRHDLLEAITATLEGDTVETPQTTPIGCLFEAKTATARASAVTYSRDIAPILYGNCAECHRPGEVAPFSLLSYEDAAKRSEWISKLTQSRLMPPWRAEIGHGDFLGTRRLTEKQISLLADWHKAGAPQGDLADLPPTPSFAEGWRLGEPDLVVEAANDFTVPADGPDIFQHFVIPLDLQEDQSLTGFEFHPGNPAVVHHAILFLDTRGIARAKDAETPEPGYTTSGSIGIPVAGIVGVWTPGMTPRFFPEKLGMPIPKEAELVFQLHLHPSGKQEVGRSSAGLYFSPEPLTKQVARAPFVAGTLLLDIAAGEANHRVTSSITLPTDVTFISILPHMHLVGKEMKLTATLPSGEQLPMIWIKEWNFYWQDNYVYREPLRLPAGTRIDVESVYDNSADNLLNPSDPPQRVMFGNESTDEMCFAIFQVVADDDAGERKLNNALMQSFFQQFADTSLEPEVQAHIIEEAQKLFGIDRRSGVQHFLNGRPGGS